MSQNSFVVRERVAQSEFFARTAPTEAMLGNTGYRLKTVHRKLNLAPHIRDAADAYFGSPRNIVWHTHCQPWAIVSSLLFELLIAARDKSEDPCEGCRERFGARAVEDAAGGGWA
jgi:hypothetical protein